MSKSSKVLGEGSSVGFGDEGFSDVDSSIDSITETKEGLPLFLAALGVF